MASRWNKGWFDVHPRYSAGSPAMVDIATALSVARHELQMFEGVLEGTWGPEDQQTAQALGLRGIVEWKAEAGAGSIIAYDLLTRTWHLYHATDVTGTYESCKLGVPELVLVNSARGQRFNIADAATRNAVPSGLGIRADDVRGFLASGRYRKAAPERAQHAHRETERELNEALEDAGLCVR